MEPIEERVRFCDHCNAVINWHASYCDECGSRLVEGQGSRPSLATVEAPSSADAERELFGAHLRLIHRFKERGTGLGKDLDRLERTLKDLEARRPSAEVQRALLAASERLLDLEQDWEDLQRTFNTQSESIEEEFLDRIHELEADIELSPDHQAAVEEEMRAFLGVLESLEERLRETGRFADIVRARHRNSVLGLATGPRGTLILGMIVFLGAAAGTAYGVFFAHFDVQQFAISITPAWIGICLLFLNARAKSL